MKKVLSLIIIVLLLGSLVIVVFGNTFNLFGEEKTELESEYIVRLDGKKIETVTTPTFYKGDYFLPLFPILNELNIVYEKDDEEIVFITNDNKISLVKKSLLELTTSNDYKDELIYAEEDDQIIVSLNFLIEKLDLIFSYDKDLKLILLHTKNELLIPFGEALDIFEEGEIAVITDIETGIIYKVRRVEGGYSTLADVETLTALDTEKLLSITGGEWSNRRRAIIVTVKGINIAGSIAPFPHSGRNDAPFGATVDNRSGATGSGPNLNSIRDNNMEGVVDIFFYNSVIPGINRIDERHQEMVLKASTFEID